MQSDPGPVVIIGLREIYEAVISLKAEVASLVNNQNGNMREIADHESRIRSLEKGRWPLPSLAAILSVAALLITILQLVNLR